MGCYDEAEIFELIGTYLLYQINSVISKENIGMYRDNRPGIFKNMSGPKEERKKKYLPRIFKSNKLSVTVRAGLKNLLNRLADFLDVHFGLTQDIYQPYKKVKDDTLYINKDSTHTPTVIKRYPWLYQNGYLTFHQVKKDMIKILAITKMH